jgi:hypothetical protein
MAPRIFFRTALTCPCCGASNEARTIELSSALGNDPEWTSAMPGEALDVGLGDFENTFLTLRLPEDSMVVALELWTCRACGVASLARLAFRIRTPRVVEFRGAEVVRQLTGDVLDAVNFVTRRIEDWTPQPGEDGSRIEELKRQL